MENTEKKNNFELLNNINLKDKIKQKIGLSYLSWADAWAVLKKNFPEATWKVYTRTLKTTTTRTLDENGEKTTITTESEDEIPYFTDGKTAYVKVGVVIEDREECELLPVMDNRNNAVSLSMITMTAVNKAIQRAFVKACARHGLGLYVYAGEDLPEVERKVIDYKAIADNCDRYQTVILTQDGFDVMKKNVIELVQADYDEASSKAITDYVVKNSKGKRLSLFTLADDSQTLQRIYAFINEVRKQIAAPANSGK